MREAFDLLMGTQNSSVRKDRKRPSLFWDTAYSIDASLPEEGNYFVQYHIPSTMSEALAAAMIDSLGGEYPLPIYAAKLQPPRPFLVPSLDDDEPVEILPSQKASQKIRWEESILVKTINNRFSEDYPEDDEEGSYDIEIVEEGEDDDADFYVEIVDGEVFYVFETEDDISEGSSSEESRSDSESEDGTGPSLPAQFSVPGMELEVPMLDETPSVSTFVGSKVPTSVGTAAKEKKYEDFNASSLTMGESFAFLDADLDDLEYAEAAPALAQDDATDKLPTKPTRRISSVDDADEFKELGFQSGDDISDVLQFEDDEGSLDGEEKKSVGEEACVSPVKNSAFDSASNLKVNMNSPPKMPLRGTSIKSEGLPELPMTPPESAKNSVASAEGLAAPVSSESQASPTPSVRSYPGKSILKVCPDSPPKAPKPAPESPRRKKKEKGVKEKKTFTKTYVRAEDFDGESRVYTWERPTWTNSKLKSTGKGDMIREGGNLASPITNIEKNINAGVEDDDAGMEKVNKEELIRRLKGASAMRGHRKLKFSIHGAKIREGGDIVQPITKATVFGKRDDVNLEANPAMLKPTDVGQKARKGGNLAGPITNAPSLRKPGELNRDVLKRVAPARSKSYEWEKPEWSTGRTSLRATRRCDAVKEDNETSDANETANADAEAKKKAFVRQTSDLTAKKKYEWEKPSWTKTKLGSTGKGEAIKSGQGLEKPITFPKGRGSGGVVDKAKPDAGVEETAASPDRRGNAMPLSKAASSDS